MKHLSPNVKGPVLTGLILIGVALLSTPQLLEAQGRGRPAGAAGGGPPGVGLPRPSPAPRAAPPAARKGPGAAGPAEGRRGPGAAAQGRGPGGAKGRMESRRALPRDFGRHPEAAVRMRPMLPNGTNVHDAAAGFKNMGQFVAATNVSRNLGIPFDELKGRMVAGDSLGRAIQNSRPALTKRESRRQARDAERRAKRDLREWSRNRPRDRDRERADGLVQP